MSYSVADITHVGVGCNSIILHQKVNKLDTKFELVNRNTFYLNKYRIYWADVVEYRKHFYSQRLLI